MRIIDFVPLRNRADFFERPQDAIMHGLSNPHARRVRDELPSVKGAHVVDGRCDFVSVTFILSNGVDLVYFVHDGVADWRIGTSDASSRKPQLAIEPVLFRSEFGEYTCDPLQMLSTCIGREIVSMSANLSTAQLLLRGLPLAFFPSATKETGEQLLQWGADEIEEETNTGPSPASS